MIVNTRWLLDYLSPRVPLADLLTALPRVGLDVEATHVLAHELAPVRVGFIRAKKPLEGAHDQNNDKFVGEVEVGHGDVRPIVGAWAHPNEDVWASPGALARADCRTG